MSRKPIKPVEYVNLEEIQKIIFEKICAIENRGQSNARYLTYPLKCVLNDIGLLDRFSFTITKNTTVIQGKAKGVIIE